MKTLYSLVITTSLLLSHVVLSVSANCATPEQHEAYLIRTQLAGVKLDVRQKDFIWFDPSSGYYLAKVGAKWEHATAILMLTPDRHQLRSIIGSETEIKALHIKLPLLRDGNGVNIGDSVTQVHRKLGEEPEYHYSEYKSPQRTEVYFGCLKMPKPQHGGGSKLKTFYTQHDTFSSMVS